MKQLELTSHVSELWTSLDRMHSKHPLEAVIAPFASALFLLRWADHLDTEQEAVATFDGHDYLPALPRDQHWSSWSDLRGTELVDVLQEKVLPALHNAPNTNLGQFLQRLVRVVKALVHESPEVIEALVQWVQAFNLETATHRQVAGDALVALVEKTAAKAETLGDYTTPRPVVEMMTDLIDPSPGERIYDPCFGTGGLLSTVASKLREKTMRMPPKVWTEVQQHSVFGIEISPYGYSIGLARVVLAGIEQPRLELGDALERPLAKDRSSEGFDCILAVPPWGRRARPEATAQFQVSATNIETLFLQHVMASLRPGGRAIIALPDSALFRTGPDQKVRKELLTNYCVEGVVSLPAGAFHPYTGIKTSLVLFRREKAAQAVRFMQVEEWPSIQPEDGLSREKAVEVAHSTADEFRSGTPNDSLWETPVKELKARDWELVAKRTGEEALSRFLRALQKGDVNVSIQPLNKVAEIFTGVSYGKSVTTPHGDDPSVFTGLVRVADVNRTGVQSPSLFLTKKGNKRVQSKHRLRAGDILLTTSGTIGKLAVVSESTGTVGAVAAKSLVVIRPKEQLSSQFLKSLLASDAYQEWLRVHARGATIQHLSVQTLRHLPVLVPQVPIQERVVKQVDEEGNDPFAVLVHILMSDSEEPIVSWLMGSSDMQELRKSGQPASRVAFLERIAHSVWTLQNQVASSRTHSTPQFADWLKDFAEAIKTLQGLSHVPPGAGRMALLDSAQHHLKEVYSAIRKLGDAYFTGWKSGMGFHSGLPIGETMLPAFASAIDVTKKISRLVRAELDSILEDVKLEPRVEPSAVVAGTENEIQVRVKNLSPLALRNISVSTSPSVGSTHVDYLAEEETLSFTAKIPADAETGPFQFVLRWQADRFDGRPVSGELPLAVDVRSTREFVHLAELGTSPYIVGSPIDREEMFFGRQDIIDTIQRQLSTSHRANVILLEGNRRTGKTSILKRLQAPNVLPGWIVAYCSLQGGEGHESKAGLPTNEVFRLMARDIGWAMDNAGLQVPLPDVAPLDPKRFKVGFVKALSTAFSGSRPFEVFELYIQTVLEAASPRRLLLMLDEFDKLQEGIDAGITSPQVPENIRYLLHTYPGLSAILTGSRRLKRLREEYRSALFGFGHRIPVSELPLEDARLLVTRPVEGRLAYLPKARDSVVELCSRQPFLIQSLCNRIFEHAAHSEQTVKEGAVNTVAQEMVQDNEHFRTLWGYAETERRRFVLALCQQLEGEPDPITLSLLETKLEECGIALPHGDRLGDDLEFLRELELLELQETARGSAYMLAVPLMAAWIRRNIDFEDQRQQAVHESEEIGGDGDGRGQGDGSGYGYGHGDGRGRGDGSGYGAGHRNNYNSTTPGDE
ncbi:MAG: N-6 DNA methylase [Gemmatimonadetes bacterium]|nr:N-6 DNA methylase [Gemmatimonadota bacterium]MYB69064.1 N-6 DNA methylase [Gemmatimonadota bacterium]